MEDFKHKELTGRIIGCAMQVHRDMGRTFQKSFTSVVLRLS
jgi:hypothetical protein